MENYMGLLIALAYTIVMIIAFMIWKARVIKEVIFPLIVVWILHELLILVGVDFLYYI